MADKGYLEFVSRIENVCAQYADKTAIVYMRNDGSRTEFTFGKIFEHICAAKEKFAAVGLRPGDRAAIIAPNSPFSALTIILLAYSNITSVLVDATIPMEIITRLLATTDVRAIFTAPSIFTHLTDNVKTDIPIFELLPENDQLTVFEQKAATVSRPATDDPALDVFTILFSSGTTNEMKGVEITFDATLQALNIIMEVADITNKGCFLHALPLYHIAGFNAFLVFFMVGGNVGMIEGLEASKLQKSLQNYKPTHFLIVPKVYEVMEQKIKQEVRKKGIVIAKILFLLLSLSGFFRKRFGLQIGKLVFRNIRKNVFGENIYMLGTGGSLCSESTAEFFLALGVSIWANFYALTEANTLVAATTVFDRYPAGTEGYVKRHPGIEVKINDPDENGIGEILAKTSMIMKGYFRDLKLTTAAFDEDGYFKTGDLGYIDRKGYLHVTGRIKEAIMLHTGKKVAPSDVDSLYSEICPNLSIAACGVPNRDSTFDEIHLFIECGELSPDAQQETREKILDFSAQTSTLYQISGIHFIDKFPLTSVGKVKRFQLKAVALSERE